MEDFLCFPEPGADTLRNIGGGGEREGPWFFLNNKHLFLL